MSQNPLLADPQALALESFTSKDTQVILVVKTIHTVAPCPKCHQPSSRVHSCSDLQTERPQTANKAMSETTLRLLSAFGDLDWGKAEGRRQKAEGKRREGRG